MTQALTYTALLLLVIIGIIASLYFIMLRILQPNKAQGYTVVIIADEGDKDAACKLSAASMRVSLLGDSKRAKIVIVDYGMDSEERRLCENICRNTSGLFLCRPDETSKLILK